MNEENKMREELKAQAAEAIDALSLEELESVSGGANSEGEGYTCPYCGKTFGKGGFFAYMTYAAHIGTHPESKTPIEDSDTIKPANP